MCQRARRGFSWVGLLTCALLAVFGEGTASVSVNSEKDFQAALVDEAATLIIVEKDLVFSREVWEQFYSRAKPYIVTRNLTIESSPPYRKIDFSFAGVGRVQLAPGIVLNTSETIFAHARYGAGVQLDFLSQSPGSYLVLWNSVMLRMACLSSREEPDAVAVQPRLLTFPGQQVAKYVDQYCLRGQCFNNVLVYADFTKVTGATTQDTAAGGYAIIMQNFTKVCTSYLADSTCITGPDTVDECVQAALDRIADIPTPGRLEQEARDMEYRRHVGLTVGIVLGVCGALLLPFLAVLWSRWRRRRLHGNGQQKLLHSGTNTPDSRQDPELGGTPANNKDTDMVLMHPKATGLSMTPPNNHNSWELAACKTSDRFLHSHYHSSSTEVQSGSNAPGGSSWILRSPGNGHANQGVSASELLSGGANSSKVTLGVLLGAGSFARVYCGKWRGLDTAVKVLQHSQAAAASVANEVDLMMSFQHPNVVSAHHFVTWKKRTPRAKVSANGEVSAMSDSHHVPNNTIADPDMEAALSESVGPTGEFPDDTQTWIVQEYCDAGNLGEYCIIRGDRQQGQLPEGHDMLRLLFRLKEVAEGMNYLHQQGVVHGDLKSGNVMLCVSPISPYGRMAKITDFGLSRALAAGQTHRSTHTLGTVSHMAPEALRYGKMSPAVDVYSCGVMSKPMAPWFNVHKAARMHATWTSML
eukprot:GHRR01003690.1.p1 GENE.GHRR01003690.1~~GHRR01003690.1.p1  ORF type:complete len:696 (+),score=190.53 GHRR01003690.1:393-2480(+)